MDAQTFSQVLDLIQMLAIIVGMILLHNSVPAGKIDSLFDRLEANAKKTTTTVDDAMVSFGRLLSQLFTGQLPGQAVPATDPQIPPSPQQQQPVPVAGYIVPSSTPQTPDIHSAPTQLGEDKATSAG